MKKTLVTVSIALASFLTSMLPAMAQETWTCQYKGSWVTKATGNTDNYSWTVYWLAEETSWRILGNYRDKYGFSWLDGSCQSKQCKFTQSYKDGKLQDKSYYWAGKYTDVKQGAGSSVNNFTGTWGYSEDNYADGGTWKAQATCKKNPEGFDVDAALNKNS